VEALRVIGAAMAEARVVGIGRLTLSRRERMVMVEPRGIGMALFTLRAADEVRAAQFGDNERDLDTEMVAIARAIIGQRLGKFDPSAFRGRYQEELRGLIEAKLKGVAIGPQEVITAPPPIDLMAALKRSLAQETPVTGAASAKERRAKPTADRRQRFYREPAAEEERRSPRSIRPPSP
jgi:DNA end-binding protein Ku